MSSYLVCVHRWIKTLVFSLLLLRHLSQCYCACLTLTGELRDQKHPYTSCFLPKDESCWENLKCSCSLPIFSSLVEWDHRGMLHHRLAHYSRRHPFFSFSCSCFCSCASTWHPPSIISFPLLAAISALIGHQVRYLPFLFHCLLQFDVDHQDSFFQRLGDVHLQLFPQWYLHSWLRPLYPSFCQNPSLPFSFQVRHASFHCPREQLRGQPFGPLGSLFVFAARLSPSWPWPTMSAPAYARFGTQRWLPWACSPYRQLESPSCGFAREGTESQLRNWTSGWKFQRGLIATRLASSWLQPEASRFSLGFYDYCSP